MIANTVQAERAPETKATKKATTGARRADVAPAKGKAGKKAATKRKAPKSAQNEAREGSKTAAVLELLKRAGGATAKELLKATGWQPHSLRGFLSGTVGKKMGLAVTSAKEEDGERHYSVKASRWQSCLSRRRWVPTRRRFSSCRSFYRESSFALNASTGPASRIRSSGLVIPNARAVTSAQLSLPMGKYPRSPRRI